jgi:hypothetical protein
MTLHMTSIDSRSSLAHMLLMATIAISMTCSTISSYVLAAGVQDTGAYATGLLLAWPPTRGCAGLPVCNFTISVVRISVEHRCSRKARSWSSTKQTWRHSLIVLFEAVSDGATAG